MRKPRNKKQERGFTVAEIITVVAIISILALIVIPKFWSRTEEARIARAKEEMARISDAEGLAFADTGFYVHPGNLHTVESQGYAIITTWDFQNWVSAGKPIVPGYLAGYLITTVKTWKGPYITYQPSEVLNETSYSPLDPWKNEYLFYGPVTISAIDTSQSTKLRIWSRGPNLRFDGTDPNYLPWGGTTVDDILYVR